MKTKWWILIFSALVLLCLLWLLLRPAAAGARIGVFLDGELLREIDLRTVKEPYSFTVSSAYGENTIQVEPGRVYMLEADCPDGVCLRHKALPEASTPIVCLPHRLVLRSLGGEGAFDAVSGVAG